MWARSSIRTSALAASLAVGFACGGSGAAEKTTFLTKWIAVIVGILVLLVAVGTVASFFTDDQSNNAPPGKVWSPDHGHWHDAR